MPRKPKNDISGWINLHKPAGCTSNDALMKIKRALNFPKIGHAGTLDPLASGILPIALGEATKLVQYMMEDDKIYVFTVQWGEQRTTDDAEGEIMATSPVRPDRNQIEAILPSFTGEILQKPPTFSAIKVDGQRAYAMARAGEIPELQARPVHIYEMDIVDHFSEQTTFRAVCGKGTYVRSLARDMGLALGTYGTITHLLREAVGPFTIDNAIPLAFFDETGDNADLTSAVFPIQTVLDDIPVLAVTDPEAQRLRNGQRLTFVSRPDVQRLMQIGLDFRSGVPGIALAIYRGKALAMLEFQGVEAQPVRVFNL